MVAPAPQAFRLVARVILQERAVGLTHAVGPEDVRLPIAVQLLHLLLIRLQFLLILKVLLDAQIATIDDKVLKRDRCATLLELSHRDRCLETKLHRQDLHRHNVEEPPLDIEVHEAVEHIVSDVDQAALTLRSASAELPRRGRVLSSHFCFFLVLFPAHLDILSQIVELVKGLLLHLLALNTALFNRLAEILADLEELV